MIVIYITKNHIIKLQFIFLKIVLPYVKVLEIAYINCEAMNKIV